MSTPVESDSSDLREIQLLAERFVRSADASGVTVAVAESLTGGEICARLVDIPGASSVLRGGIVAYQTDVKQSVLRVDAELLEAGGPVQAEVARQMARSVANLMGAQMGLATTGVAGPGETPDGPAGLVFVAVADSDAVEAFELRIVGSRQEVRNGSVVKVLSEALAMLPKSA